MSVGIAQYKGRTDTRLWSPALWGDYKGGGPMGLGIEDSIWFHDDFVSAPDCGTITTVVNVGPYEVFGESGTATGGLVSDISTLSTGYVGGLVVTCGTTTNHDTAICLGGGAPFVINSSDPRKLWFEARLALSSVTNDIYSTFIGLGEEDLSAGAGIFADEDNATFNSAFADKDLIGFYVLSPDGDALGAMYGKAGQTAQNLISSAGALTAATFVKVGFKYDPTAPISQRITFFVNGAPLTTYVTHALQTAATFPDGEEMTMLIGTTNSDGSTDATVTLDWWSCAQMA